MSALVLCAGCAWGDHSRHDGSHQGLPDVIGGHHCPCTGGCVSQPDPLLNDTQPPELAADTEALAKELARHRAQWVTQFDGKGGIAHAAHGGMWCECGEWDTGPRDGLKPQPWDEYHRHVTDALLASGAVKPATQVREKALAEAVAAVNGLHLMHANTTGCWGGLGGSAITPECAMDCPNPKHARAQEAWRKLCAEAAIATARGGAQ